MSPLTDEEVAMGPLLPELLNATIVGEFENATVRLVDGSVPLTNRRAIARVAYVAQRAMPTYKTGYDGTVTEDDQRVYVLTNEIRAIGMVLTAMQNRVWRVEWAADGQLLRATDIPIPKRVPVIARVWIANHKRRSGLGRQLLECALCHLGISAPAVGWEFPFSNAGATLVRAMCPKQFHICCDNMTLQLNTKLKLVS